MDKTDWIIFITILALFIAAIVFIILSFSKKNAPKWYLFVGLGLGFAGNLINFIRMICERNPG